MIGINTLDIRVQQKKKPIRIVNSVPSDLKKKFKNGGQCYIYTYLYDDKLLSKLFFTEGAYLKLENVHRGEIYSLRNTSRMQNTEFLG